MSKSLIAVAMTIFLYTIIPTLTQASTQVPRDLYQGMFGEDVRALQVLLNEDVDTQVAAEGPGSQGEETTFFGPATKAAVIKMQEKHADKMLSPLGLQTSTGFFGQVTMAVIQDAKRVGEVLGEETSTGTTTPATVPSTQSTSPSALLPSCEAKAAPSSIVSGKSATLTWKAQNATVRPTVTPTARYSKPLFGKGRFVVSPTVTTTYVMEVKNESGVAGTCSVVVTVAEKTTASGVNPRTSDTPVPRPSKNNESSNDTGAPKTTPDNGTQADVVVPVLSTKNESPSGSAVRVPETTTANNTPAQDVVRPTLPGGFGKTPEQLTRELKALQDKINAEVVANNLPPVVARDPRDTAPARTSAAQNEEIATIFSTITSNRVAYYKSTGRSAEQITKDLKTLQDTINAGVVANNRAVPTASKSAPKIEEKAVVSNGDWAAKAEEAALVTAEKMNIAFPKAVPNSPSALLRMTPAERLASANLIGDKLLKILDSKVPTGDTAVRVPPVVSVDPITGRSTVYSGALPPAGLIPTRTISTPAGTQTVNVVAPIRVAPPVVRDSRDSAPVYTPAKTTTVTMDSVVRSLQAAQAAVNALSAAQKTTTVNTPSGIKTVNVVAPKTTTAPKPTTTTVPRSNAF